jgi:hypothetical protein
MVLLSFLEQFVGQGARRVFQKASEEFDGIIRKRSDFHVEDTLKAIERGEKRAKGFGFLSGDYGLHPVDDPADQAFIPWSG